MTESAQPARALPPASLWIRLLARTVYRRVVIMECRLDRPLPVVAARVPARIALLTADDLGHYTRFRPDAKPDLVRQRLARGHRCFAAWHEGAIVHAGWAAAEDAWVDYLGCEFPLGHGDVYQFDSFTAAAFRGLDLAGARVTWMGRYFRDAHLRRLLAVVWPENTAGFRPLEKAGYRRCGWLRVVRLGPWRHVIASHDR